VEEGCGWRYETMHADGKAKGRINYTVWSDVFVCPDCAREVVFWEAAVDKEAGSVLEEFPCPHCRVKLTKRQMERAWVSRYDAAIRQTIRQAKQVPVLINYTVAGNRSEKTPDTGDLALIAKIEKSEISHWFPSERMPEGQETRRNDPIGATHSHHFYSPRNLRVLSSIWGKIRNHPSFPSHLGLWFTSSHAWGTRLNRLLLSNYFKKGGGVIGQTLQGTLYISSIGIETSAIERFFLRISSVPFTANNRSGITYTASSTSPRFLTDNSFDYIFVDPPFGANITYSELNSLWEAWLGVRTNIQHEAIEDASKNKTVNDYRQLMNDCFNQAYKALKPGRWITVEFSNTSAAIWNSIQLALAQSGFIVANVSVLDKSHKGYRAVTTPTAVKQDLVISAYKPNGGFEGRFLEKADTPEGVWDFVRTHLKYLPVAKRGTGGVGLIAVPERDPRILFDQMVAYYIRKGHMVPMDAAEFQVGLEQRFSQRDGMYFLPEQAAEYDRRKMAAGDVYQASLFINGEGAAIEWLRRLLKDKPMSFQDIHPLFMRELGGWPKYETTLELSELLQQNFLCYDGKGEVPGQIHGYLSSNFKEFRNLSKDDDALRAKAKDRWYVPDPNKAGDLEKLRERALLREFEDYRTSPQKRLKVFRLEAVRAGFRKAWQNHDYATIIAVAKKIPENVLQEDPKLLMWHDQALTRMGGE
ncbi:MAG: DNA methylase, partial [Syntrophorhabdaceae bacterium]|nr:DNA methylase [Syntrophorhabdaceae bacterium]